jgi:cell division protein FtsQ
MAVTVPSDRRFRRSQIHATRRRRLRARPILGVVRAVVALGVLGAGGYWLAHMALASDWLRVRAITVHGNRRVQSGEVLALVEGLRGDNLLTTDLPRWRSRLFASAWIADATLRRHLPGTVDIQIRERTPVGIARVGSALMLIDASGTIIDEYGPRYADCDLPMIDGLVLDVPGPQPTLDRARTQLVARVIGELQTRPDLNRKVSQIDVRDAHDVHLLLNGDSAILRLGDTQFVDRLDSYVGLQAALRQRVPEIDYVDLRFAERVYVGPVAASAPARDVQQTAAAQPAAVAAVPGARIQR